ncbi:MAG: hypothetical protein HOP14_03540 [Acidobacteria bacterium]|nr:hypothetical protein [Acidobacteriota bacterium]
MDEYLARARASLQTFDTAATALADEVAATAPSPPRLPASVLATLTDLCARLATGSARLAHSFDQIEVTGLDIVDLQARMEGESGALASALRALGEVVNRQHFVREAFADELFTLEEAAEHLAAATFPGIIQGVQVINRTLWEFRLIWNEYTRRLTAQLTSTRSDRLSSVQVDRIQEVAFELQARFDAVNELLNLLVVATDGEPAAVRTLIGDARTRLREAVRLARSRAGDAYKPFHGVLKRAERLAQRIDGQFAGLRVPVFPSLDRVPEFAGLIDDARYASLAGPERFALLNIAARMRSIALPGTAGEHLLAPRFGIRVFDVFPDRVYFEASARFIESVRTLHAAGLFEEAPASLHRFNEGSYKQVASRVGNLQVSYLHGSMADAADRATVRVDADIDLYRSPVRHLFGEVLVNHLTGSRTDQFKVWDILAGSRVLPLGGFDVIVV